MVTKQIARSLPRCPWVDLESPLSIAYHDHEWCVPSHDERYLFEMLLLEGAQAGLSWHTILNKRAAYRRLFDGFDPKKIVRYSDAKLAKLMLDASIVRNQLKIRSAVINARAFLEMQREFGSFSDYLWRFTDGKTLHTPRHAPKDVPATTSVSDALSKDLKRRGFKFVGSTICYAYMQAVGMVDDHLTTCFRAKKPR